MDLVGVRTMEFCRRWGLVEAVENCPYPPHYRQDYIWATSLTGYEFGRERFTGRADEKHAPGSPQKRERCPQDMFDPILLAWARRQASATVRHLCRLVSFKERDDKVVATVEDLSTGAPRQIEAACLVGCDGASSVVRNLRGITLSGNPAVTYTTNVIFRSPALKTLHDKGEFYRIILFDQNGMWATIVAINGRDDYRMSIVGNTTPRRYSEDEIRAAIRRAVGCDFPFEIVSIMPWIRRLMVADSYGSGRVWLCGDAVHMFSPTGAFGMNTGIQDAVDLSWKLEAVLRGWGGPHLLQSYEIERRPIGIRNITEAGGNLQRMVAPKTDPILFEAGAEADAARARFGRAYSIAMSREWFTTGIHLGQRYEHSPIVVPDGTPEPPDDPAIYVQTSRPGHRAPHVWISADGRSTLDLFGSGFVLMRLGEDPPDARPLLDAAAKCRVPVSAFESHQPDLVFAYEKPLVLVRPDGMVAWRGTRLPQDCNALLETICGFVEPKDLPRPEVGFGQRHVLVGSAQRKETPSCV